MSTYTPKINLRKPDYTDIVNVTTDVDNNMQNIDDLINCSICTSTTRPDLSQARITDGQLIYETDTGNILMLLSGQWVLMANQKFGKGRKAFVPLSGVSATSGTAEVMSTLTATLNVEAGRKYLVELTYTLQSVTLDQAGTIADVVNSGRIRWAAGATVTTAGTQLGQRSDNLFCNQVGNNKTKYWAIEWFPNITGQATIGYSMQGGTSTQGTCKIPANASDLVSAIAIRDWGI